MAKGEYGSSQYSLAAMRNVEILREGRGMSRERLVKELEAVDVVVTHSTLTNMGTGRLHRMSLDLAIGFSRIFDITVEDLALRAACDSCKGAPPAGFTCNQCGARAAD